MQERKHQTVHPAKRRKTAHLPTMLEQNRRSRRGVVTNMESFSSNSARSYIGKNVNLHLKDGAVIVNVQLTKLHKCAGKNNNLIEYVSHGKHKAARMPLRNIAWAEMLNINFMQSAG
jgi:hypothetical protein